MREADWAEWMIARFTGRDRAASIVGDLLESQSNQGALWFWLSFIGIVLSLNRRRLVAFFVAFMCFHFLRELPMPVFAPLTGRPPADELPEVWGSFFVFFGWIAMLLWVVTPYALLRYGFRDRFGQVALAFCVPITASIYGWRVPACVATSSALVLIIFVSSLTQARWRRPFLCVVAALIVGYGGIQAAICLGEFCLNRAAPSVSLTSLIHKSAVPLFGAAVLTFAYGSMRQLLLQRNQQGDEIRFSKLGRELCDRILQRQE